MKMIINLEMERIERDVSECLSRIPEHEITGALNSLLKSSTNPEDAKIWSDALAIMAGAATYDPDTGAVMGDES